MKQVHTNSSIVCRVYACIADMLGFMAGEAGIRAGPAANLSWQLAFSLLEVVMLVHVAVILYMYALYVGGQVTGGNRSSFCRESQLDRGVSKFSSENLASIPICILVQ